MTQSKVTFLSELMSNQLIIINEQAINHALIGLTYNFILIIYNGKKLCDIIFLPLINYQSAAQIKIVIPNFMTEYVHVALLEYILYISYYLVLTRTSFKKPRT